MKPYRKIFVVSLIITIVLFCYDYQHYVISRPTKQLVFDLVLWGGLYTLAIFLVASVMYFCFSKVVGLIKRIF